MERDQFDIGDLVRRSSLWDRNLNITGIVVKITERISSFRRMPKMYDVYWETGIIETCPDWIIERVQ